MKLAAIALTNVRRLFRDRAALFFVFLLPLVLILVIGVIFGGGFTPRIGITGADRGPLGDELVAALRADDDLEIREYRSSAAIVEAVERGDLEAGVVLPDGYDAALRAGESLSIDYLSRPSGGGFEIQSIVQSKVVAQAAEVRAARFAQDEGAADFEDAIAATRDAAGFVMGVGVEVESPAGGVESTVGQFDLGAAQNLVLFTFVTALAASAALIQSRRLGVSRRMLSTPTRSGTVVMGETLGRFSVTMVQSLFILFVAAIAFGVNWGDPVGAGALVLAFALVGTGAGMLVGATFSNDEQAGGIGTFLGLGLGALGGCMVPLEVFSDSMRRVAHVTPHAWALDGFSELIRRDGGIGDITTEIAVLLGFAAVLLAIASWRFRRVITR